MERVLFDTNVILDIALKRLPHFTYAMKLFTLIDKEKIIGHVTASTITDIYYLSKKEKGHNVTLEFIRDLIEVVKIIGVDRDVIVNALSSDMKDFEDAIQVFAAEFSEIDCIITRNEKDFTGTKVEILNPKKFLEAQK